MSKKLRLMGFKKFSIFPIEKDSYGEYEVGNKITIDNVISMTREIDSSEEEIHADDTLYANVVDFKGIKSTITLADISLELMAKLGFGEFNEATKEFNANPQGLGKTFGATFACQLLGGGYRMFKFYNFTITAIKDGSVNSKGAGSSSNVELEGIFSRRKIDDAVYTIKDIDGKDLTWLDNINPVPTGDTVTKNTKKGDKEGA